VSVADTRGPGGVGCRHKTQEPIIALSHISNIHIISISILYNNDISSRLELETDVCGAGERPCGDTKPTWMVLAIWTTQR
jgi:hypothetical protein